METRTQDKEAVTVSVIVPVYNAQEYLPQCLESIRSQTHRQLEILLVDDGSTDGSGALCDACAAEDPRVRVIHKTNGGLVSAWKAGVAKSTGPYLFFVDSDDWIDADLVALLVDRADLREDEVIASGYLIERAGAAPERKENGAAPGEYTGTRLLDLQADLIGNEQRRVFPSRCMKLFARELFLQNMTYVREDIRMGEDLTVTFPCLLSAGRVVILRDCGYHYRFVKASMVHRYDPGLYQNIRALHTILCQMAEEKAVPEGRTKADREFLFLMFVELKNQLRRPAGRREVTAAIRREAEAEHLREILDGYPEKLADPASRLLAMIVRHPDAVTIAVIRRIFLMKG